MPDVIWSETSRDDVRWIDAYVGSRDAAAASRILGQIAAAAKLIERFPGAGAPVGEFRHLRVRMTPYILLYRLAGPRVEVVRIRHGRENWLPAAPE